MKSDTYDAVAPIVTTKIPKVAFASLGCPKAFRSIPEMTREKPASGLFSRGQTVIASGITSLVMILPADFSAMRRS